MLGNWYKFKAFIQFLVRININLHSLFVVVSFFVDEVSHFDVVLLSDAILKFYCVNPFENNATLIFSEVYELF